MWVFSTEIPFSQITLACLKLTHTHTKKAGTPGMAIFLCMTYYYLSLSSVVLLRVFWLELPLFSIYKDSIPVRSEDKWIMATATTVAMDLALSVFIHLVFVSFIVYCLVSVSTFSFSMKSLQVWSLPHCSDLNWPPKPNQVPISVFWDLGLKCAPQCLYSNLLSHIFLHHA